MTEMLAQTPQTLPATAPVLPAQPPSVTWHQQTFLNNTVLQWLGLLGVLIATFVVGRIVSFILRRQGRWWLERPRGRAIGMLLTALAGPAAMLIFAGGLYLIAKVGIINLRLPSGLDLLGFWGQVCKTIAVLAVGWAIYGLVAMLEGFLAKWTSRTRTELDDQLVPVVRKALRVVVVIVVALFIAQNIFHWNIGAFVASLGLGGLAFALAAQDSLKNFFGSVLIFTDRPFQLGDWVRIGEHQGIIEEVGFRSTRLRTFDGHLVTIPNASVASTALVNVARRPSIRRVLNVTITYDTPPEKVERAIRIIRDMLDARAKHFPPDRPGQVYFNDFNAASLNLIVYYWFRPPDFWESLTFAHDFNLELLRRFNQEGIEFAFPTQTLYLKQDSDLLVSGGGAASS